MKDSNFLKEHNGRLMWHPMTSPQDSIDNPPKIITSSEGVTITDLDGHSAVDGVGGLWNVKLGVLLPTGQRRHDCAAGQATLLLNIPRYIQ